MGQLANSLSIRNQCSLLSNTETKRREHVKATTLRSGKELEVPRKSKVHEEEEKKDRPNIETSRDEETKSNKEGKTKSKEEKEIVKPYVPLLPFPQMIRNEEIEKEKNKFFDMFRKVHKNVSFKEMISLMPKYVQFFKDLISNKMR